MDTPYLLEVDRLSVGLTRPPTQFGVPLTAFYANGVLCFLGWTALQSAFQRQLGITVFFLGLFIVAHLVMAWLTFRDPFGLSIFWINRTRFKKPATYAFWHQMESYAP